MMKYISSSLLIMFLLYSTTIPFARSQEKEGLSPVSSRAKEIVEDTHAYILEHSDDMVAVQQALQNDSRFHDHDKELYIFMHCYKVKDKEAICCGQGIRPELVGKNMWHLRTPNGRLLFHEMARMVERAGGGWIEYEWLNPYQKRIQTKRSYVKGIVLKDGRRAWVGCGFWKD
jgi:signal transduction histidine kinase